MLLQDLAHKLIGLHALHKYLSVVSSAGVSQTHMWMGSQCMHTDTPPETMYFL